MIDKKNIQNIYELTPMQNGILFSDIFSKNGAFFEQISFDINSKVDIDIFQQSWNEIVSRYDVLRTNFIHKKIDEPLQIIFKKRDLNFHYENISSQKDKLKTINNYKIDEKKKGFNLSTDKLFKIAIFKQKTNLYTVIINFHHILMDGWCSSILYNEFKKIYISKLKNQKFSLPKTTPYVEYIKWLRGNNEIEQKKFWGDYLKDYKNISTLPNKKKSDKQNIEEFKFEFSQKLTNSLTSLAKKLKITLNTLLQTLWGILLSKYNDKKDVVFGTIVSGRPTEILNVQSMVGLFMNTIAIRIKYNSNTSFQNLALKLQQDILNFGKNEYYPLAKIQALTPLKNNLLDHSFVFENYPEDENNTQLKVSNYKMEDFSGDDFTIQVIPSEKIYFKLIYNSEVFTKNIVENIEKDLGYLTDEIILNHNIKIDDIGKNIAKKYKKSKTDIVITASFTTDNIKENLEFWGKKFQLEMKLTFSGYNQIFQELIDDNSKSSQNRDINIFLIRFEDFIRGKNSDDGEFIEIIENSYNSLLDILKNKKIETDYFFGIFPISTHLNLSKNLITFLNKLNEKFIKELKALKNIFVIDFREIANLYQVEEIFDILKDKSGHLPFSDEFYIAYSTEIFRNIYALKKQHFKVIALDCDNTLWGGIVGEDGALGVKIDDGYLELQKFILEKEKEGFLIVLNSKNNENDVWEVFDKNENMLLKREHIVNSKINWQPKSQNLKEMAKELNLGLNSFIFLDDNPLECSEIIKNAPEVLSLPLPKNPQDFKKFLNHIWALDKLKITAEDKQRTKMYIAESQRNESQKLSLDDFLSSLELKIYMNKMLPFQLPRTAQLTNRTNQFNISTIRRGEGDIKKLLEDKNNICWTINVEDKFGDYGLVGVIITKKDGKKLIVDTFLMSCRVLGRGVEKTILAGLKKYSIDNDITKIELPFFPTAKNKPALNFIESFNFKKGDELKGGTLFYLNIDELPESANFVLFNFDKNLTTSKKEENDENKNPLCNLALNHIDKNSNVVIDRKFKNFEFDFLDNLKKDEIDNLLHKKFYTTIKYNRATDILKFSKSLVDRDIKTKFIPPTTNGEIKLAKIYKELLNIDSVGVEDSFFDLGGHSLMATRVLSRLYREFNIELSLRDIFENPTIKNLLTLINLKDKSKKKSISPTSPMKYYPLSNAQKRVWLIDKMGGGVAYNMPIILELEGDLNIDKFELAFNQIIARHEILRTKFILLKDEPYQKIIKQLIIKFDLINSDIDSIKKFLEIDSYKTFDLNKIPLFRIKLFKMKDNKYIFYFNTHHIISDGWSLEVITDELYKLYNGDLLEKLEIQYKDYTVWQKQSLNSKNILKDKNYWHKKLQGAIEPLNFPIDFPRFKKQSFNGNSLQLDLSDILRDIENLNKQHTTTLFIFLTSIVKIILAKYSNQNDIILGFPISGRDKVELENQIGFYANTLILRDKIDFEKDFKTLLIQIKQTVLEAHEHQQYPFEKLVNELNIKRDISHSPLFDYTISLNNQNSPLKLSNIKITPFNFEFKMAQFDMSFNFNSSPNHLILNLNYNSDLFKESSIKTFLKHFENLIRKVLKSPNREIKNINFLNQKRDFRVSKQYKNSIIELFQKQVKISPNSNSINFYDKNLTYKELDKISNSVANYLIDKCNIKNGDIVAFHLTRSELSVISILGILKANATFLPLNISLPKARMDYILKNSNSKFLLNSKIISKAIKYKKSKIKGKRDLNSSAYIIYTSGTTGNPKGVEISENSLLNLCKWYIEDLKINNQTKALLMIPTSFDASIKNILAPLFVGGEVIISKEQFEPYDLIKIIEERKINLINCVPSAFKAILDISKSYQELKSVKYLAFGGESLNLSPFKDFYLKSNAKLFNIYGPTEACDISTIYEIKKEDLDKKIIPIGKGISNSKIYILDKYQNLTPKGVIGELIIGGVGIAKGYINNKKLTDKNFIKHKNFGKIYKTGDLAKELNDGNIQFIGRSDDQVKIRGNRVEISEIEHKILEMRGVNSAFVLVKNNNLVTYLKLSNKIKIEKIKEHLQNNLPPYMIPSDFIKIKNIPLTQNGKVDKKRLLEINQKFVKKKDKNLTSLEQKLLTIFETVLNKNISINDNFFEVGGDSLNGIKVISQINKNLKRELKLSTIFEYQNIKDLANFLENEEQEEIKPYTIFNKEQKSAIVIFPALIDSMDYKITSAKLAKYLTNYKIYSFDFILDKNRIKKYLSLLTSLEKDVIFMGYSSGGNLAFEIIKKMKEKPKKLILLDSWKIKKFHSVNKNKVLNELKNSDLEINQTILDKYIKMLNSIKNINKIDVDIDLITLSKGRTISGDKYLDQNWKILTNGSFKKYSGFGNHLNMLKDDYLIKNCKLIRTILREKK